MNCKENCREIWKPIEGHNGYEVSCCGRVRLNADGECRVMNLHRNTAWGYLLVTIGSVDGKARKTESVARMVATAFCDGKAEGLEVDHIDGDKENNCMFNLEWVTPQENKRRARVSQRIRNIADYTRNTINAPIIHEMNRRGITIKELSDATGIKYSNLYSALGKNKTKTLVADEFLVVCNYLGLDKEDFESHITDEAE